MACDLTMNDPIQDADFSDIGVPKPANGGPSAPSGSSARPGPSLDRGAAQSGPAKPGVTQPKPQALPKRSAPSSILVSTTQKGNALLNHLKSLPWEYSDIPADYVVGNTTCALFLSLKYHRLHPEYIYKRIRGLAGRYLLRIVLVLVDIGNHEESLRELSKTSLINNVTLILCWSAAEGARYLELFKTYENAAPTTIKQHQSTTYSGRMTDFITTPRSINKTDAVSLVGQFGSIRTAINARHEDVAAVPGWGEKKVERWCRSVREPFRVQRAAKRGVATERSIPSQPVSRAPTLSRDVSRAEVPSKMPEDAALDCRALASVGAGDADARPRSRLAKQVNLDDLGGNPEAIADTLTGAPLLPESATDAGQDVINKKRKPDDDPLSDGVMAALSKLRKAG